MKDMKTLSRGDDQMASYSAKAHAVRSGGQADLVRRQQDRLLAAHRPATHQLVSGNQVPKVLRQDGTSMGSGYYFELSGTSMASPWWPRGGPAPAEAAQPHSGQVKPNS